MLDEQRQDEHRLEDAPAGWRRWWAEHGERELRCILMTAWDPIPSGDAPEAWDEYDNYMPGVARRLREALDPEAAAESVAAYLNHVQCDYMGDALEDVAARNRQVASTLVAWHEWSFTRGGRPPAEWI
jgi:hypothetical protein